MHVDQTANRIEVGWTVFGEYHNNNIMIIEMFSMLKKIMNDEDMQILTVSTQNCRESHDLDMEGSVIHTSPLPDLDVWFECDTKFQRIIQNMKNVTDDMLDKIMKYFLINRMQNTCGEHDSVPKTELSVYLNDRKLEIATIMVPDTIKIDEIQQQFSQVLDNQEDMKYNVEIYDDDTVVPASCRQQSLNCYIISQTWIKGMITPTVNIVVTMQNVGTFEQYHSNFMNVIADIEWKSTHLPGLIRHKRVASPILAIDESKPVECNHLIRLPSTLAEYYSPKMSSQIVFVCCLLIVSQYVVFS